MCEVNLIFFLIENFCVNYNLCVRTCSSVFESCVPVFLPSSTFLNFFLSNMWLYAARRDSMNIKGFDWISSYPILIMVLSLGALYFCRS